MNQKQLAILAREIARASESAPNNAAMNELIRSERDRLDSEEIRLLKRLVTRPAAISES
jgi:hypothetical protein